MIERKASDILLDLEAKIEALSQEVKLISFNQKNVLDKLNSLVRELEQPALIQTSLKKEPEKQIQQQKLEVPKKKPNEVLVQQKILYPDGSPIILAKIIILKNEDKKEFKVIRSKPDGKWACQLPIGDYIAHIVKESLGENKPLIDRYHEFSITNKNEKIVELPISKE